MRACQTDDEKELVHSRYPCELEGTRARVGRVEGGRTRARMERAVGRGMRERGTEKIEREREREDIYIEREKKRKREVGPRRRFCETS